MSYESIEPIARDAAEPVIVPALVSRALDRLLNGCDYGRLTIETPGGQLLHHRGSQDGPEATLAIRRWRTIWKFLTGGDLGFARAYIDGDWESPDLAAFFRWALANERGLAPPGRGMMLLRPLRRLEHRLNANTRRGSRRNIVSHYDLGNDFYSLWLDPTMNYSSALYTSADQSLDEAQHVKIDRAIALLNIAAGAEVLEIGCGWGAVAEKLAAGHDCRVTGITLSDQQLAYARARLARQGLGEKARFHLRDYRAVSGQYDGIVSIEMLEAVGERYWPTYFRKLHDSLKPGAAAVVQVITIAGERFENYRRTPDFIQRYIFPGGMLPTADIVKREIARAGLTFVSAEFFGSSYARTLAEWQRRFQAAWPQIRALNFDQRFKHMWEYYLAYCEAGFTRGAIDVGLFKMVRASHPLPATSS